MKLIAVITGDIVNSTKQKTVQWQSHLKKVLQEYGKETIDWEINRGDYFQIRIPPQKALIASLQIKATIKQLSKSIDVRMSIGVGKERYRKKKISLCTGEAYTLSGRGFDTLKKQNIVFYSYDTEINDIINAMLSLSLLTTNKWTPTQAKTFLIRLKHPNKSITQLSVQMKKSTSTISEALQKLGYNELMMMNSVYQKLISKL